MAAVLTRFLLELTPPIIQNETLSVMLSRFELQNLLLSFHVGCRSPPTSLFEYHPLGLTYSPDLTPLGQHYGLLKVGYVWRPSRGSSRLSYQPEQDANASSPNQYHCPTN